MDGSGASLTSARYQLYVCRLVWWEWKPGTKWSADSFQSQLYGQVHANCTRWRDFMHSGCRWFRISRWNRTDQNQWCERREKVCSYGCRRYRHIHHDRLSVAEREIYRTQSLYLLLCVWTFIDCSTCSRGTADQSCGWFPDKPASKGRYCHSWKQLFHYKWWKWRQEENQDQSGCSWYAVCTAWWWWKCRFTGRISRRMVRSRRKSGFCRIPRSGIRPGIYGSCKAFGRNRVSVWKVIAGESHFSGRILSGAKSDLYSVYHKRRLCSGGYQK